MNKGTTNLFSHPLIKLAYGIIIIAFCYFAYQNAYKTVAERFGKLTQTPVLVFDSLDFKDKIKTFKETDLEVIFPIGQKVNISVVDASAIAEQSLKASLNRKISVFKPFAFYFDEKNQLWMVEGSNPAKLESGEKPGHPYVIIQKKDGKVISIWMSKDALKK